MNADPSADSGDRRSASSDRPGGCVLAIDTSLGAVSACLYDVGAGRTLGSEILQMERGHAEALLPLIDRLTAQIDGGFAALDRVSVTVGPGSFTGIRVGVAAARALGLACKIPVVGVSTLAALAAPLIGAGSLAGIIAAIDARHGHVYAQVFAADGRTLVGSRHARVADLVAAAGTGPFRLVGSGAPMVAIEAWSLGLTADVAQQGPFPDISFVARLGALADPEQSPPKPLYLKPPDAKPQAPLDQSQTPASTA